MSRFRFLAALCAAGLAAAPAQAAVIATLTFDTPTGVVFSNEAIPVFVTLHLDAGSDAITTDAFGEVTGGLSDADISAMAFDDGSGRFFDPLLVTRRLVNNGFECSGTFTSGCGPGAYAFDFNYGPQPSFIGAANLNLQPGSDTTWLFGTFNPVGGNAAAGLYTFYNAIFEFEFIQPDDMGGSDHYGFVRIASTCDGQNDACAFTREVLAAPGGVPEPATWALLIVGFGGAGAVLRRKRALA